MQKKKFVPCVKCKLMLRVKEIRGHIEKSHPSLLHSKTLDQLIQECITPECPLPKSNLENKTVARVTTVAKPEATQRSKLLLVSRRGSRDGSGFCEECGRRVTTLWRYAESNKGTVRICERCKASAFDRSFGSRDAMSWSCQAGSFDSSRRRH